MPLRLDFTNMMAGPLPGGAGLTAAQWAEGAGRFATAHAGVPARHAAGTRGFCARDGGWPRQSAP
ncbi:MAG TPA: hypothetical protein PKE51_03700, partial [Gemmatimonadaceae bacterium]|nr:hypothetical protein [Gemmatimonadaceae bacterium]